MDSLTHKQQQKRLGKHVISRVCVYLWFAMVGVGLSIALVVIAVPNEFVGHVGLERAVGYMGGLVLVMAIAGLPLLILAALIDTIGKRRNRGAESRPLK